ncbi:MAG TPA: hypothetical protein VNN06_15525 [Ramlibacter sp.]|nr:hypothetical protein [Ramlibacter sp.]
MTMLVHTNWLTQVLGLMPARVLKVLDAWSYRLARKRSERRRLAVRARKARAEAVLTQYRLKP